MRSLSQNVIGGDHASAWWSGLAWSHLWQTTAVMIVVSLLVMSLRRRPHWVYLLWLLVLLKCVTPPILSSPVSVFGWLSRTDWATQAAAPTEPLSNSTSSGASLLAGVAFPAEFTLTNGNGALTEPSAARLGPPRAPLQALSPPAKAWPWREGLLGVWWLGIAVMVGGWWRQSRRLARSRATWTDEESLQAMVLELATRLGVSRFVRVQVSPAGEGPGVVGWWHPTIVIPSTLPRTDVAGLEPILAHELIHVRRGDPLHALLQRTVQVVWWFHPLVWWVNRECSRVRERCCDEEVLASRVCPPQAYARCLVDLLDRQVERRSVRLALEMRPFDVTKQRLEKIMQRGSQFCLRTPRWGWVTLALLALIVLPGRTFIAAQNEPAAPAAIPRPVQDALAESLKELGHHVATDDKRPDKPWTVVNLVKKETARAAMPLVEKFHGLEWFSAQGMPLEDADVARMARLTKLKSIFLNGTKITDAALVHLRGMTQLEQLLLDETAITDAGLKHLQALPNLKTLTVSKTAIGDEGVKTLARFPKLEHVRLDHTKVTTAGLMPLKTMATLKSLSATQPLPVGMQKFAGASFQLELTELTEASIQNLGETTESANLLLTLKGPLITSDSLKRLKTLPPHKQLTLTFIDCPVTDADFEILGSLPTLAILTINSSPGSKITDAGLAHLRELKQLSHLNFDAQHITDEGMRHLGGITSLQFLHLMPPRQVTDAGVRHLAGLKELTHLSLFHSQITDASLRTLASLPKLTSLMLDQTAITDAGLAQLEKLPNLGSVTAVGTKITQTGIDRLKARHPKVFVLDRLPPTPGEAEASAGPAKSGAVPFPLEPPRGPEPTPLSRSSQDIIDRLRALNVGIEIRQGIMLRSRRKRYEHTAQQNVAVTIRSQHDLAGVLLLLTTLPELDSLVLDQCRFGEAERGQLRKLKLLHSLSVAGGEFGDAELACLSEMSELNELSLGKTLATDDGLLRLPVFPDLYSISAAGSRITDRAIDWVVRQPCLERVHLAQSGLTPAGANRIAALPNLIEAHFDESGIPDRVPNPEIYASFLLKKCDADIVERIRALGIQGSRFDSMRCGIGLQLSGAAITDDSLQALDPIADVVVDVHLAQTAITEAGFAKVCRLPYLVALGLHQQPQSQLTGKVVASHLRPLFTQKPSVPTFETPTTEATESLADRRRRESPHPKLRVLFLNGVPLEQADLAALQPAFFLAIFNGQLTDDKLKGFRTNGFMILDLNNEPITDKGLLHLAECKNLNVQLHGSKATEAGVAELRKRNPNIVVTLSPARPDPTE